MTLPMLPSKESLTVEFKSDRKRLADSELLETVVGMANAEGGTIYLGVEDDGRVTGLHPDHREFWLIGPLVAGNTMPSVAVQVEGIETQGVTVAAIRVAASRGVIATRSGKTLRRTIKQDGTPETLPFYPYEFEHHLSTYSRLDFTAKPIASMDPGKALDPQQRERLRRFIRENDGEAALLDLTDEELDGALRLTTTLDDRVVPTIAGLLLIGHEDALQAILPTARASFQVLDDTSVRVNQDFTGPIVHTLEKMEALFSAWNHETETDLGMIRQSIPEFSRRAFREAIVNAFVHRDYTILQGVILRLDETGLTISSPGGFIDGVQLDNLLTVEPHGRNPVLSDACKRIGLGEKTGRGIDRIFAGSILYGRPLPDYSATTRQTVRLVIPRSKPDLMFMNMLSTYENQSGKRVSTFSLMILSALQHGKRLSMQELAQRSMLGPVRAKPLLEQLIEAGLVERLGSGRNTHYVLSKRVYRAGNNLQGYVHQRGIDAVRFPEMMLKYAQANGGQITRRDVIELLRVSDSKAYSLLKGLTNAGRLRLVGTGRGARYELEPQAENSRRPEGP